MNESGGMAVDRTVWNIIRSHLSKETVEGELEEGAEVAEERTDEDGVQQIIYVTYQDPDEMGEARTLHIVDSMEPEVEHLNEEAPEEVGAAASDVVSVTSKPDLELNELTNTEALQLGSSHSLQVTDEDGNPIQFTMQDGRELQITTTDGQSLQVTTVDGQTIPLQLTSHSGQPFATEMAGDLQSVGVAETQESAAPEIELKEQPESHEVNNEAVTEEDVNRLVEGEQTLEFTTQDGQKVRFVTTYDVDPLQLTTGYLTPA